MEDHSRVGRLAHLVHENFLWLLLGSYAVAAIFPGPGLWIRKVTFGPKGDGLTPLSLPALMLALLLLNAGLGVEAGRLLDLVRRPLALIAGLAANLVVPLLFIVGISQVMRLWHNFDEFQNILVGLTLVAAMPIAGSSSAWAQNANGDLALSLGLVVLSTLLSPLTTPVVLNAVGGLASGKYAASLHHLAAGGAGTFLALFVLLPSLIGIALRMAIGAGPLTRAKPVLKLLNAANLLALTYSNASVALPHAVAERDWDFLGVMLVIVLGLCVLGFVSGWALARLLREDEARRTSLVFGLGMNNNGTGLVLASTALAQFPSVMLPVIFYNLVQHIVAAIADRLASHSRRAAEAHPT